ncbi:MAG TPA: cytochrome c [Pyrinomonadaceae bacterium]|nr:cytochrome c [Pyrinomonadaceae bacterium]
MIGNTRRWIAGSPGFFLIAIFLFQLTGFADAPAQRSTNLAQRSTDKAHATDVAEVFRSNCARCHGVDGRGDTPLGQEHNTPDLTAAEWWHKNSALTSTRSLTTIVREGKGDMPAFGEKLKPREISDLLKFMRKFRTGQNRLQ